MSWCVNIRHEGKLSSERRISLAFGIRACCCCPRQVILKPEVITLFHYESSLPLGRFAYYTASDLSRLKKDCPDKVNADIKVTLSAMHPSII